MSFEGFSDKEIQKITTNRPRKPEVKTAKKIPCHTSTKKHLKDENENSCEKVEINGTRNHHEPLSDESNGISMQNFDEIQLDNQHPKNNYEIPETRTSEEKIKKLEDFEMHRRLMEEQNKMKRNLLKEAISKHAEKTQAEAKKLEEITVALTELDSELQQDVSILRKEIENATLHFNKQEREYCAIEKSFLKAKQELYLAHERKEMLTEHLYTIIQYNEDRKAKKLTELMDKVGLSLNQNDP